MDDLQYGTAVLTVQISNQSFKPCYKWMTFNTENLGELIGKAIGDGF